MLYTIKYTINYNVILNDLRFCVKRRMYMFLRISLNNTMQYVSNTEVEVNYELT